MARKKRQAASKEELVTEPEQPGAQEQEENGDKENDSLQDAGPSTRDAEPAQAQQICDMLESEVEARAQQIMDLAEDAAQAIRNELKIQLLKLPKKVRQMPLANFQAQYAGNINAALIDDIKQRLAVAACAATTSKENAVPTELAVPTAARTTRRTGATVSFTEPATMRRNTRSRAAATPAVSNAAVGADAAPDTVARVPKHGEMFYSVNGSPLGIYAQQAGKGGISNTPAVPVGTLPPPATGVGAVGAVTILRQASRGQGARTKQTEAALVITTEGGRQVTVDEALGLKGVPIAHRKEVEEHLLALQRLTATALKK